MTRIIELSDRVFEITVTPDTPGYHHRQFRIRVLSGPLMTGEEADRVSAASVAELVGQGQDVYGWSMQ